MSSLRKVSVTFNVAVILTIHQPGERIQAIMQNLYMINAGRMVYFGPLSQARRYFAQLGYDCPEDESPADYSLRVVINPPEKSQYATWALVYEASDLYQDMKLEGSSGRHEAPRHTKPSTLSRIMTTVRFLFRYYRCDPGYVKYRIVYLVVVAVYFGTLFFDLKPEIGNLSLYNGAIFYLFWGVLFASFVPISQAVTDSKELHYHYLNSITTPVVAGISAFVVSAAYNFVCSWIFYVIFNFLT
jgi:hypothetical protein